MAIDGASGNVTYFHPPSDSLDADRHNHSQLMRRVQNFLADTEPTSGASSSGNRKLY